MPTITSRLADFVSDVLLHSAGVTQVDVIAPQFVRVELKCDAFCGVDWTAGSKVQFRPARGTLQMRSYTPMRWDAEQGRTELVAFVHGAGPAADWFREVSVGDVCEVFGPRHSIDLDDIAGESVFVGDESSLGLACALRSTGSKAQYVFEASDPEALEAALAVLGFTAEDYVVTPKDFDRKALLKNAFDAAQDCAGAFDLVISGDAATVLSVRRNSRDWPQKAHRVIGKAYWARGRAGLE